LTKKSDENVIIKFLEENILSPFGCPHKIVTDNAHAFKYENMITLCQDYGIELVHSTTYYPQGNGLAESSNKTLVRIIKNMLDQNKQAWDSHLKYALWTDRIDTKDQLVLPLFT